MAGEYPKVSLDEWIIAGKKYSYRYYLSVPYTHLETFKPAVSLNGYAIRREFPGISYLRFACVYVAGEIPGKIDLIVVFERTPGLTHQEFSDKIKEITTERYWDLTLRDIILLEKAFPWWALCIALVIGGIAIGAAVKKGG